MKKLIYYVSLIILFSLTLKLAIADYQDWILGCGNYWGYWMMWYSSWFWYFYFLIFLWILVALFTFWFKYLNQNTANKNKEDVIEILKRRLASWEITEEEYESKKKKLLEK